LRSMLGSPLFVTDASGKTMATPIKKSYAEGLDVGDYWVSMYGARKGSMDRSLQTSLPGAFSKDVMATVIDHVVSSADCKTTDGITLLVDDHDAIDRFLAGDQHGIPRDTLVTHAVQNQIKHSGGLQIKVRSPLTCHQAKGVCAKCHGLDEHGHAPSVGDNVGAVAGQTMSEPLVQMIMQTRHSGGVAGAGSATAGGYKRIDQLLKMPDVVAGAATLAPVTGKITSITKGVGGGFNIKIGTADAYVASGLALRVKVGQEVHAGDKLCEGLVKPQDLVALKGMFPAQQYIVSELQAAYKGQGVPMPKRVFETVVRSLGNTTKILNNPKDSGHVPGDVASYTVVQAYNRNLEQSLPTAEAEGYALAVDTTDGFKAGHVLTHKDCAVLEARGVQHVTVKKEAIKHAPYLTGIQGLPALKQDWMASLGYRGLEKALTEGASRNWKTDLSGYHPIPALAHGASFGNGKEGKY